jgi:hypothetical protein
VNRVWMRERLGEFISLAERYGQTIRGGEYIGDRQLYGELFRREPTIKAILEALDPKLPEVNLDQLAGHAGAANVCRRGMGILDDQDELAANLASAAPSLAADRLHPWVWGPAGTFWDSQHYRQAVEEATRAITAHTQHKVGRSDIADDDLMAQAFSGDPARPGSPRLRMPGDRTTPTWRSRQNGVRSFAAGCYAGIRNLATHEHGPDWPEQIALEYLAALSVLARWIDECEVETAQ